MNTQNHNDIFVFDMDNTLIKTDKANNLAYSEAIKSILGVNSNHCSNKRFTRTDLKELYPELNQDQFDEIITRKERFFEAHLKDTELNDNLVCILKRLHKGGCRTILLTNSRSGRAISLCNYYNLTKYYDQRFFYEDCDGKKYSLLKSLGYDLNNVVLFENEEPPSTEALSSGIKLEKIIKIEF